MNVKDESHYEDMSVEELASRFESISRQRISQILLKFEKRGDFGVIEKIKEAKKLLKESKLQTKQADRPAPTTDQLIRKKFKSVWRGMKARCYNKNFHKKQPKYRGCTMSPEFLDFEYFFNWAKGQVGFGLKGYELDKDILVKGNTVYSPSTCVFVPKYINNILIRCTRRLDDKLIGVRWHEQNSKYQAMVSIKGQAINLGYYSTEYEGWLAYKAAKEAHLRATAEEYKDRLDFRVYEILKNYIIDEGN